MGYDADECIICYIQYGCNTLANDCKEHYDYPEYNCSECNHPKDICYLCLYAKLEENGKEENANFRLNRVSWELKRNCSDFKPFQIADCELCEKEDVPCFGDIPCCKNCVPNKN